MIEVDINKRIKTYKGWEDLRVKAQFDIGKVTQITGPSGAGKTTLLKMIAGLITPEKGMIKFEDTLWFDAERKFSKRIQERNVGFVFQDYALFPNMTVEEQLAYGTSDQAYIGQLLELGEMEVFRQHLPAQLSGGQQQRLAILRALSTKPDLLLMDESFSALDRELKSKLLAKLQALFLVQGTTVLLVTHDDEILDPSPAVFKMEA
ncbi:ATP-binding cassette domain-containing protein [Pedobacter sp. GR22-10]|uniref:ATP-binding cassette domain-containing protein n=1 Tax=Pedobacter sp. GR22-10 TaxID=2994472 RepID=UPI0022450F7A|nr:ATP-binding cassette domain-containing protein [Pedobacter sp. GR22-10]MCX2429495.1 ATP-binding cassette domain-containing protein [Pedobacter sp. GR22-10]